MPICRGPYFVFNIDFDVIEHSKKKVIPRSSVGSNTAINFSYVFETCLCFFFPDVENLYCILFKVFRIMLLLVL